jgi:hypothetical protein
MLRGRTRRAGERLVSFRSERLKSGSCVLWRRPRIHHDQVPSVRQPIAIAIFGTGLLLTLAKQTASVLPDIIVLTSAPTQDAPAGPAPISHTSPSQTCPCLSRAHAAKIRRANLPDRGRVVPRWRISIPLGPLSLTR